MTEWKESPPSEPGWYWACANRPHGQVIYLDYVLLHDGQFCTEEYGQYEEAYVYEPISEDKDITHWLGPLPVPAPPD